MKAVLGSLCRGSMVVIGLFVLNGCLLGQTGQEECTAIYNKFLANRKGPEIEKLQSAVSSGKEYLTKCSSLPNGEQVRDYVSQQTPKVEETLQAKLDFQALDSALKANDAEKSFELGKKVLGRTPDNVDVMIALALVGHDAAFGPSPVDKFNDDALRFAKTALAKLNDPATSTGYFKSTDCADGRATAIGWTNYVIGHLTLGRLKDTKSALPYLYRSTQTGCATRTKPETYQMIGAAYFDEFQRLESDRKAKVKAAGDKDTDETKAIYALEMGYIERIMDAYGRAYNLANADAKFDADRKSSILAKTKQYYEVRHEEGLGGFDEWLKALSTTPFPDPSSTVAPVVIPPPAKP